MIYKAYELLAKLNSLTMTVTDGKIEWIGTDSDWKKVEAEEQNILENHYWNKFASHSEDFDGLGNYLAMILGK